MAAGREHDIDLGLRGKGSRTPTARPVERARPLLPQTDIFHFYFGQTLVPKTFQFPILKATRRKCVMHFLGDDIRGKTPDELAYGKRADRIVGSYAATCRWVPEAVVVPPGLRPLRVRAGPPVERERPLVVPLPPTSRRRARGS